MTRLTIIGSSHLGAIKNGWTQIASDYPDLEVSFFGAPADSFWAFPLTAQREFGLFDPKTVTPERLKLIETTNGRHTIDLAAADKVLLVGWRVEEIYNAQLLSSFSVDGVYPVAGRPRMSRNAYEAMCDAVIERHLPAPEWRNWTGPSLHVLAKPRMAETCVTGTASRVLPWAQLAREAPGKAVFEPYLERFRKRCADIGVSLLLPPDSVYGASGLTRANLSVASRKPGTTDDFDHSHMNTAYGKEVLRAILPQLC